MRASTPEATQPGKEAAAGRARGFRAVVRSRLVRGVALPVFVTILAIEALLFVPAYQQYKDDLLNQVAAQALGYVRAAGRLPGTGPSWLLQHLADATENARWTGVAVIGSGGRVLGSHDILPGVAKACPGTARAVRIPEDGGAMEVCWPAERTGLAYAVAARFDIRDIRTDLEAYRLRLAVLALLVAGGATAILLVLISRRVLQPIINLQQALTRVAADPSRADGSRLPDVRTRDEIADLVRASQRMLDHVADAMTAYRRQNDALRQSEARFREIFEKSYDAILIVDPDHDRVVDMNPAAVRLLNRDAEAQALPETLHEIYPEQHAELGRFHAEVAAHGHARSSAFTCVGTDGAPIPVDVAATHIDWDTTPCVLHLVHDMREHQRLQRALTDAKERAEEADRMKTRFLASMSHELRTPLNAIIGFSEIIGTQAFGPVGTPKYRDYANDILASARHLHEMINDILDISKIEAGRMEVQPQRVDLADAVYNAQRLITPRAAAKQIAVEADLPFHPPVPFADERHLRQILINLLANAVKFTPEGGRIVVGMQPPPDGLVRITVTDSGPGMDEADAARALEPFRQAHGGAQHGGTGLGLPLCKRLAEINGGRLTLDTEPGRGTTVIVDLPAGAASEPVRAAG